MVPVGAGGSFTVPPLPLVLNHVSADRAGSAGGVLNTARQLGGAFGVAAFGVALSLQPFISGLQLDFRITAVLIVIAGLSVADTRD